MPNSFSPAAAVGHYNPCWCSYLPIFLEIPHQGSRLHPPSILSHSFVFLLESIFVLAALSRAFIITIIITIIQTALFPSCDGLLFPFIHVILLHLTQCYSLSPHFLASLLKFSFQVMVLAIHRIKKYKILP